MNNVLESCLFEYYECHIKRFCICDMCVPMVGKRLLEDECRNQLYENVKLGLMRHVECGFYELTEKAKELYRQTRGRDYHAKA